MLQIRLLLIFRVGAPPLLSGLMGLVGLAVSMSERRIYFGFVEPTLISSGWDCGVIVMIIHGSEVLGPEHLAELSALFEKTWATYVSSANSDRYSEERAQLACILLRLYRLRQLGPDQIARAALRLMGQSSPAPKSGAYPATRTDGELEPQGASTSTASSKAFGSEAL